MKIMVSRIYPFALEGDVLCSKQLVLIHKKLGKGHVFFIKNKDAKRTFFTILRVVVTTPYLGWPWASFSKLLNNAVTF